ncbi:MAG: type II 3-dehydroquinate dehydratase [Lentisphaeria bacterium]|jgi:3-dehydroquinate dehydratase-2|nr:type II 3-dehydroquinate dehydratase [Lentisphaeria bacterium]
MKILVINGPNLGLLGVREPDIYGHTTLADVEDSLRKIAGENGCEVEFLQSNHEGVIVDRLNDVLRNAPVDGIVINPAAYTHTSVAIADALRACSKVPAIEVHISNISSRESFRHESLTAPACTGMIAGLGVDGYEWALRALLKKLGK